MTQGLIFLFLPQVFNDFKEPIYTFINVKDCDNPSRNSDKMQVPSKNV